MGRRGKECSVGPGGPEQPQEASSHVLSEPEGHLGTPMASGGQKLPRPPLLPCNVWMNLVSVKLIR